MSPELLEKAQQNLHKFPPAAQQKVGELIAEAHKVKVHDAAKNSFMTYVNYVWPNFIHGKHHERMAAAFERVASGKVKRLIINMPPRHT